MAGNSEEFFRDALYIDKAINARDEGKDYFEIKLNRFPKGWLDLEVYDWSTSPASSLDHDFMNHRSRDSF